MIWKDRIVTKPRTFTTQNNADSTVTLIPAPGEIIQEGTPCNAANMNFLELMKDSMQGTTQVPTYAGNQITKVEHKDTNNVVIRTDTFIYTKTVITEKRTLNTGQCLTWKYYFDTKGNYLRTEVT